jgi:hypothetical protein
MVTQLLGDRFSSRYEVQQQLGKRFSLTEPEVDWLASELSDWLGMPIAREKFLALGTPLLFIVRSTVHRRLVCLV